MGNKVIIAEKPSVAKAIAKIVGAGNFNGSGPVGYMEGNGWRVTWAFGHLIGLLGPEQMGFDRSSLPMFPDEWKTKVKGKIGKDRKEAEDPIINKQLDVIEHLFNSCSDIVVATDAGREGELIFRYIYEYLGCRTPFKRLWISSLTDEAISKGMRELKNGHDFDALSNAAHSRSEADWLVGFNASKALRIFSGYRGSVSLGRVQTPTLGMICERYIANKNFVPTPFWQISADTQKNATAFTVLSEKKYTTKAEADTDHSRVRQEATLRVSNVEKKHTSQKPPLLYDLTALQRAANSKYGLTAEETLQTAQSLYEKKFLSYPRTGSRYIPEDVFKTIPDLLKKMSAYGELGKHAAALEGKKLCRKSVNDSKVTDHHALLPTGVVPSALTGNDKKVFELVMGRMVEAFGENYEADVTTVTLISAGVIFKTRGSVPTYLGWKAVYGAQSEDEEKKKNDEEDDNSGPLPEMKIGDILHIDKSSVLEKTDKPLPIYTDATLLGEMETCGKKIEDEELRESMKDVGLGTPATRASIIELLLHRKYVERDGKKLVPTKFGLMIWDMVKGRKISDVKTTGEWEKRLHQVETGDLDAAEFNKGIKNFVGEIIEDLRANCTNLAGISADAEPPRSCPICGKTMSNGKFSVWCDEAKGGCGFTIHREIFGKKIPGTAIDALAKGKKTPVIKGFTSKSGKKFDAPLKVDREQKKVVPDFPEKPVYGEKVCPCCGGPLVLEGYKYSCGCGLVLSTFQRGARLSEEQVNALLSGKSVNLFGLKSKEGKIYNMKISLNTRTKEIEGEFLKGKK